MLGKFLVGLMVAFVAFCVVAHNNFTPALVQPQQDYSQFAQQIIDRMNEVRASHGLPPLRVDAQLTQAALAHSRDMAAHGFFSHIGSDGSTPTTRAARAGYDGACGENLLLLTGEPYAWRVVQAWMDSPAHRANVLEPLYTDVGVGIASNRSEVYVTADFGYRR